MAALLNCLFRWSLGLILLLLLSSLLLLLLSLLLHQENNMLLGSLEVLESAGVTRSSFKNL